MAGSGETYQSCKTCSLKGGWSIFTCPWRVPQSLSKVEPWRRTFLKKSVQDSNLPLIYHVLKYHFYPSISRSAQVSCFLRRAPDHHPYPDTIIPSPVSQGPTLTLNCGIHISLHSFLFMPIFLTSLLAS